MAPRVAMFPSIQRIFFSYEDGTVADFHDMDGRRYREDGLCAVLEYIAFALAVRYALVLTRTGRHWRGYLELVRDHWKRLSEGLPGRLPLGLRLHRHDEAADQYHVLGVVAMLEYMPLALGPSNARALTNADTRLWRHFGEVRRNAWLLSRGRLGRLPLGLRLADSGRAVRSSLTPAPLPRYLRRPSNR